MIPISIVLCIIKILMTGNFWDFPLPYDSGCVVNSPCRMSFFDQFNVRNIFLINPL
jgi:hypothetical protein